MSIADENDDPDFPTSEPGYPESLETSARIWRFSGFDANGNVIAFEFAGPLGQTDTVVFRHSMTIGRDSDRCDIPVPDRTVSRVHAKLRYFIGEGLKVQDLSSANGTFVDGERVGQDFRSLRLGSELTLGQVNLRVSYRR